MLASGMQAARLEKIHKGETPAALLLLQKSNDA